MKKKLSVPDYMKKHKELVGVCVGKCVLTGKWDKGQRIKNANNDFIKDEKGKYIRIPSCAHAHTSGPGKGWICFHTLKDFEKETTCKHELAHIITSDGHTKKWAEQYVALGTPKWLTVEWLQKKYGFDDDGGEGTKVVDDFKKFIEDKKGDENK